MNIAKKILIVMAMATSVSAASGQSITLPAPAMTGGLPVNEALAQRRSVREYDPQRELSQQQISNLLWAAAGVNRPDGYRTNPTAMNSQEIDVYLFTKEGVWLYDFRNNSLTEKARGDHRKLIAGTEAFSQDFVMDAPVALLMVADLSRTPHPDDHAFAIMAACDAGIVSENINLFCAGNGLATVPRATMDSKGISALLNLSPKAMPILNNPVGYEKK